MSALHGFAIATKEGVAHVAGVIDAAVEPLRKAAILAELNFKRKNNDVSGFASSDGLDDDDHGAWSALSTALAEWEKKDG